MRKNLYTCISALVLISIGGCYFDQEQLIDVFDDQPAVLHAIANPFIPPPGIPNAEDCDVPPQPISLPFPAYPEELRRKRAHGEVTILFIIDSLGVTKDPQILFASDTLFAQAVLASFPSWKIAPAKNAGKPVTCFKRHTIEFTLSRR
jgi:TonB family protein